MSFLAPLFLLGALAVAGPILFHLIRRTTRERRPFSTLMFLHPTPPRVQRRSRLEHVFLLFLRCLVLCLLALGFARPLWQKALPAQETANSAKRVLILVDHSASMRRENLWLRAQAEVSQALQELGPEDQVALFAFDRELRPLVTFEQWRAMPPGERVAQCLTSVRALSPGWAATDLGNALLAAAELLEEPGPGQETGGSGPKQIILVSDLARGSRLTGLQGYEWRERIEVTLRPLRARQPTNAGLQPVGFAEDAEAGPAEAGVRVRVANAADSTRELFQLGWLRPGQPGRLEGQMDVYVAPGASRVVRLPEPEAAGPWTRLGLQGDDQAFDNTAYVVAVEPERRTVIYIGKESETDPNQPFYYLRRAFQSTRRQEIEVALLRPDAVEATNQFQDAALLIVADVLPESLLARVKEYVSKGRTALFLVKTPGVALALSRWPGLGLVTCEEGTVSQYALLGQIDFEHPLFLPFAEPRFSDFTKIHFWKYRRIPVENLPGAKVLAAFDNGAPALLEFGVGRGTVLLLTSGWQPADSQLALSSKFVPLLYAMLQQSSGSNADPGRFEVGDKVNLAGHAGAGPVQVLRPDGSETELSAPLQYEQTDLLGIYRATSAGWTQSFAVNLAWAESKTAPLAVEELEQLGVPLRGPQARRPTREQKQPGRPQMAELENRQKLWRWLILTALGVLLLETWLAGWLSRTHLDRSPTFSLF